ncbi:MAG: DUF4446 family protein [Armatimonadetes bacterium]|nr:DUF4446 family protein [Armatimonadota bacterium]
MREVGDFITQYNVFVLLGVTALAIILLFYTVSLSIRLSRLTRRRSSRLADGGVEDIVESINDQSRAITKVENHLEDVISRHDDLDKAMSCCLQRMGVVRFNAFDDVGGEQSFSLALLDARNNGIVISSIYGRQDSRIYVKGIVNGEGERPLSQEETKALKQALT